MIALLSATKLGRRDFGRRPWRAEDLRRLVKAWAGGDWAATLVRGAGDGRNGGDPQEGERVDGEVLRRLIGAAGDGVRVRDSAGRTGIATAVSGGLAVVTYADGVERLDPAQLAWAGLPMRTDPDPTA